MAKRPPRKQNETLAALGQAVLDNVAMGAPSITGVGYDEGLAERNPYATHGVDLLFMLTGLPGVAKGLGKLLAKKAGTQVARKVAAESAQQAAAPIRDITSIRRTIRPTVDEMAEAFDPALRQIRADKAELETMRPLLDQAARKQKKAGQVERINEAAFQALTQGKRERANRLMEILSDYRVRQEDQGRVVQRALDRMAGPVPPIREVTKNAVENLYRASRNEPQFTQLDYSPFLSQLVKANDRIPIGQTRLGQLPLAEQLRRQPDLPTFRATDAVETPPASSLHLLEPDDLFRVQRAAEEGEVPLALLRESIERGLSKRRGMLFPESEKQKLFQLMDRPK